MSDQEFRDQMLHAIEALKQSNERSIEEVKHVIQEVKREVKSIDAGLRDVQQEVAWIKGKFGLRAN